ncbi:hypothetical protein V1477_017130 [Vespula maculifrons]|uniref:Uncharacterized protein n=1 Tax=Vespula maculifrons TaxID=7453 RepID=A0ABD2B559_VESMC
MKSVFPKVSKIYSTKFTTSSPLCPLFCQAPRIHRVLRKYQGEFSAFIRFMLTSVDLPFQGISQSSLVLAVTRKRTSENLTSEHARCPTDICAKTSRNTVVGIDLKKCWTVVKPEMLSVKSGRSRDTIEEKREDELLR